MPLGGARRGRGEEHGGGGRGDGGQLVTPRLYKLYITRGVCCPVRCKPLEGQRPRGCVEASARATTPSATCVHSGVALS